VDITLEENTTLEHLKEAKIDIKNKTLKKFINLITELEQDLKINKVKKLVTWHNVYKDNEVIGTVPFDFHNEESQGTIKFISLLGPIYDTLKTGRILIIDELDSRLHPILTQKVIEIFQKTNKTKAQLIFASHDVTLLNKNIFRRDQIWFAEKTFEGATDLYSLVEYKEYKARKDATFEKEYLQGKYGALPLLSNLEESFYKIHE
jgi:AAA15 family ATPase/GTPase